MAIAHWPPAAKRAAARSDWLLVGAIVVYLLANLPFLVAWPAVNGDEGREANAFWVSSGVDPSAQTLDPVFRHDPLYKGGLQGLTTGVSFRLFGLGLYQGRLVSLIWGGLLLVMTFLAGRRLYGPAAGYIAVLFLAVSQPWLVSSHIIRPDIVVATLVMAGLYCALRGLQDGGRPWHLVAGLCLGLSFDVHPNSLAFMPMVGLCYVARYGWRAVLLRDAWMYVAGIAIGALYYVAVRVAPDPMHFLEAFQYWIGVDKRPPALATRGGSPIDAELGPLDRSTSGTAGWRRALLGLGVVTAAIRMVRQRRRRPGPGRAGRRARRLRRPGEQQDRVLHDPLLPGADPAGRGGDLRRRGSAPGRAAAGVGAAGADGGRRDGVRGQLPRRPPGRLGLRGARLRGADRRRSRRRSRPARRWSGRRCSGSG